MSLSGMSESSNSNGIRPTSATHRTEPQHAVVRHRHQDRHRIAVGIIHGADRQPLRIEIGTALVLPAVGTQRLPEVAAAMEESNPDEGQSQIRRRFEVIARHDPEAAPEVRVDRGEPVSADATTNAGWPTGRPRLEWFWQVGADLKRRSAFSAQTLSTPMRVRDRDRQMYAWR